MAESPVTHYGYVKYDGKEYSYPYEEPKEDEIDSKLFKYCEEHPWLTETGAANKLRAKLRSKNRIAVEAKVMKGLREMVKAINAAKPEHDLGISRRRVKTFDLADYCSKEGVNVKLVEFRRTTGREIIDDETANKIPKRLATELNIKLYEKLEARKRGIPTANIAGDSNTVDMKFPAPNDSDSYRDQLHWLAMYAGGFGQEDAQSAQSMCRLNRYAKSLLPGSRELVGFTFITRPHLNLSNANIAAVRSFAPLLHAEENSMAMAIRMLLDPEFTQNRDSSKCEMFNPTCALLIPACNALTSISGFPDPSLTTESTEGGFFSESQTCVIGADRLAKGYDLQLQFRDFPGGPILALHDFWQQYMGNIQDGMMAQYTNDVEHNLMGYTVSIYRFMLDATGRQITRWAKATGCFPKSVPTGNPFNYSQGEHVVTSIRECSIPYFAHHIGYNDPIILREFNMLIKRYAEWIKVKRGSNNVEIVESKFIRGAIANNNSGVPYITQQNGFNELVWLYNPDTVTVSSNGRRGIVTEKPTQPERTKTEKAGTERIDNNIASQFGSGSTPTTAEDEYE